MTPRIFICEHCGHRCGETCWRCWRETYGGALAFVLVGLAVLAL